MSCPPTTNTNGLVPRDLYVNRLSTDLGVILKLRSCEAEITNLKTGLNDLALTVAGCAITVDVEATVDDPVNNIYASLVSGYEAAKQLADSTNTIITVCIRPGTYSEDLTIDSNRVQFTSIGTAGAKGSIPDIVNAIFGVIQVIPIANVLITGTWTVSGSTRPYLFVNNLTFQTDAVSIRTSGLTNGGEIRINDCMFIKSTSSTGPAIDIIGNAAGPDTILIMFDSIVVNRGFFNPDNPGATPANNPALHLGDNAGGFISNTLLGGGQLGAGAVSGPLAAAIVLDGTSSTGTTFYQCQIAGGFYSDKVSVPSIFGPTSGLYVFQCRIIPAFFAANKLGLIEFGTNSSTFIGSGSAYHAFNTSFEGPAATNAFTKTSAIGGSVNIYTSGNGNGLAGGAGAITNGFTTNTSVASF